MAITKLERFQKFIPPQFSPASNPILNALLSAWAGEDDAIMQQLLNTKASLFVATAEGNYLDRLASNLGVSRPTELGLLDSDFQQLIPNLSFKPKQIVKAFYDTMDVFWGPIFSRANVTTTLTEPFNVTTGNTFELAVDDGATQAVTVAPGDIKIIGAATAVEMHNILSRFAGITVSLLEAPLATVNNLNIRTNTPGPRGSLQFISGFGALGIMQGYDFHVGNLSQRTALFQITPGEILIQLPAVVPTLRRTLKGSHHFHPDSTLASAVPPANGIWQGSFVYSTQQNPFEVTSVQTTLQQNILKGSIQSEITVADSSKFPSSGGNLIFGFGVNSQEAPVPFITTPNPNTILIDPAYVFQNNQVEGTYVNVLMPGIAAPYQPRVDGTDLPVYLPSPAGARDVVEQILQSLAAAGIIVNFLILVPSYTYLRDNPYSA